MCLTSDSSLCGSYHRLEADLETQLERKGGKEGPKGGKHSIRGVSSQGGISGGSMELSELLGVDIATLSKPVSAVSLGTNGGDAPSASKEGSSQHQQMVDILQAQRDRYKDRLAVVRRVDKRIDVN